IEERLLLKVNKEKTRVAHSRRIKFLGYSFYTNRGEERLRVHPKSLDKMKKRIRTLTSRNNGWEDERRKSALKQYITGWVQYFKLADMKSILQKIDGWYRRRIRSLIWSRWKRVKTRFKMLKRLGLERTRAWRYANTRKGCWRTANSHILAITITIARLEKAGYTFFSRHYRKVTIN